MKEGELLDVHSGSELTLLLVMMRMSKFPPRLRRRRLMKRDLRRIGKNGSLIRRLILHHAMMMITLTTSVLSVPIRSQKLNRRSLERLIPIPS